MDGYFVQVPEDEYVQMCQTLDVRKKRIELLEQLCRDMYQADYIPRVMDFGERMEELGLLGGNNE